MSNAQHNLVRIIAVAVLVALHWFPHTHAAPLLATRTASTANAAGNPSATEHVDAEPVGVATIP
jgi:hypothetical protein